MKILNFEFDKAEILAVVVAAVGFLISINVLSPEQAEQWTTFAEGALDHLGEIILGVTAFFIFLRNKFKPQS